MRDKNGSSCLYLLAEHLEHRAFRSHHRAKSDGRKIRAWTVRHGGFPMIAYRWWIKPSRLAVLRQEFHSLHENLADTTTGTENTDWIDRLVCAEQDEFAATVCHRGVCHIVRARDVVLDSVKRRCLHHCQMLVPCRMENHFGTIFREYLINTPIISNRTQQELYLDIRKCSRELLQEVEKSVLVDVNCNQPCRIALRYQPTEFRANRTRSPSHQHDTPAQHLANFLYVHLYWLAPKQVVN